MPPYIPKSLFVSWVAHHGRSEELADALGAECAFIAVGQLRNRRTAPFRHLWQGLRTLVLLMRRRPRVLIVMAPPPALVLLGLLWCRVTACKLVVDCHSKALLGRPLSARLADRATLSLVTLPELAAGMTRAIAIHDPPARAVEAARHDEVVFPASWYEDEPIEELLEAARSLPGIRFAITGKPPSDLSLPPNVRLTGFLTREDYLALVAGAPLVLALTTREATMQRAAYEAVAAGRPVVASDTVALRTYLGEAARYGGDLAGAVALAMEELPLMEEAVLKLRTDQRVAFDAALVEIAAAVA